MDIGAMTDSRGNTSILMVGQPIPRVMDAFTID